MTVTFTIPQAPKGKQRHQTVVTLRCASCQREQHGQLQECQYCGKKGLSFVRSNEYSPKEQREYERFAAMCAQQGMQGVDKFVGPVWVDCRFFFGIPKSREKKLHEGDYHTQRPDIDNCKKSVLDSANGIVWADDCSVVKLTAEKFWTTGCPRTEVKIESL